MNPNTVYNFINSDFFEVVIFGFSSVVISWFLGYSIRLVFSLLNNIKKAF